MLPELRPALTVGCGGGERDVRSGDDPPEGLHDGNIGHGGQVIEIGDGIPHGSQQRIKIPADKRDLLHALTQSHGIGPAINLANPILEIGKSCNDIHLRCISIVIKGEGTYIGDLHQGLLIAGN